MFEQSETITELAGGLLKFHASLKKIKKDASNPFYKSKYAPLSTILEAIAAPLQDGELVVVQFPNGTGLTTQVIHSSGQWIRATYEMPIKDSNNPQAVGSAITYMRRYALGAVLSLNIDEDDDGNAASITRSYTPASSNYPAKLAPGTWSVTIESIKESMYGQKKFMEITTDQGVATLWEVPAMDLVRGREGDTATITVAANAKGNPYVVSVLFDDLDF